MQQVEDIWKNQNIGYDYAVFLDVSREEVLKRLLQEVVQMILKRL